MPLGSIDVDINPDTTGLVAKLEADLARVTNPTISADVVPQVDVGAAARVDEVLQAEIGTVETRVVAEADLTSAKIAAEEIDAVVSRSVDDKVAGLLSRKFGGELGQLDELRTGFEAVKTDLDGIATTAPAAELGLEGVVNQFIAAGPAGAAAAAGLAAVAAPFLALAGFVGAPILLGSEQPEIAKRLDRITESVDNFVSNIVDGALPGTEELLDVVGEVVEEFAPLGSVIGEISAELSSELADALQELVDSGALDTLVDGLALVIKFVGVLSGGALRLLKSEFEPLIGVLTLLGLATDGLNLAFGETPFYVDAASDAVASLAGEAASAATDALPQIEAVGASLAGLGPKVIEGTRGVGAEAIAAITEGVEQGIETLREQYEERLTAAFTGGPTIAELIADGATPEKAVEESGKLADTLNKQAFGLAALRTQGFKAILAEAVAIDDPAKAGEFLDSILRLPPAKQQELEAAAAENQRQIAEAAKLVAQEQGKGIQDALLFGQEIGILEFGPRYSKSVETFFELVGQKASESFARGFDGDLSPVARAVTAVGNFAERQLRKILKSNSPSQVFMDIGADAGEGFALGLEQSRGFGMLDQFAPGANPIGLTPITSQAPAIAASVTPPQTWAPTINVNAEQINPWRTATEVSRVLADELHMDATGPRGIR